MKKTGKTLLLFCGLVGLCVSFAAKARAEAVRELVNIHEAIPIHLNGYGLVTGLSNTGDKMAAPRDLLQKALGNHNFDFDTNQLATGNVALVQVSAEFSAFMRPGGKFPVTVTSIGDAKSLEGGELMLCDLFSGDGELMARANGQIRTGAGILTRGVIPDGSNSGAMALSTYPFGKVVNDENWVRLNLKKPNWADADSIARRINQTPALNPYLQEVSMFEENDDIRPVAYTRDAGQVVIIIPDQYRYEYSRYIAGLLDVSVAIDRPATIVVNRARNTIVVTGDLRINNATVSLQDKMVTIRPDTPEEPQYTLNNETPRNLIELEGPGTYADIQGLIDTLNAMGLTTDQIITMFEQLRTSGAIVAELIVE